MDTPRNYSSYRTKKLAQLFAEARKRGIDTGKDSDLRTVTAPGLIGHKLSDATAGEIIEVIRHISGGEAEGFRPDPETTPHSSSPQEGRGVYKDRFSDLGYRDGMATPAQLRRIEAMWMGVSRMPNRAAKEKALNGFLKRIVGVEHLRFIEDWQVQKIIRAIEAMKVKRRAHGA